MLIVTTPKADSTRAAVTPAWGYVPACIRCVAHRIPEIVRGYAKQVEIVGDDRSSPRNGLGMSERPVSIKDPVSIREM
jgi:hypothetical protein